MLAAYGFTASALLAVQAEEIEWLDLTATDALASFCRGSFKGHGGFFTHSTPSNQNAALYFFRRSFPPCVQALVMPRGLHGRLELLGRVLIRPAKGWWTTVFAGQMHDRCSALLPACCTGGSPLAGLSACDRNGNNKSVPWMLLLMHHADRSDHIRHRCLSLDRPYGRL